MNASATGLVPVVEGVPAIVRVQQGLAIDEDSGAQGYKGIQGVDRGEGGSAVNEMHAFPNSHLLLQFRAAFNPYFSPRTRIRIRIRNPSLLFTNSKTPPIYSPKLLFVIRSTPPEPSHSSDDDDQSGTLASFFDLDPQSVSHDGVDIQIEKLGNNSRRIRSRVPIQATLQTIWNLLTDYERLPDFIPGLAVSQLLEKREDFARIFQVIIIIIILPFLLVFFLQIFEFIWFRISISDATFEIFIYVS
ncbi:hypothetical protein HHK36_026235 [Tetracentron sinense]|uniref:Coenzyme Q-binding protein COQ10 START domain-containing protein n=1 Tax=Tetracentron sinense TaxID=13715 RepID=A0A834YIC1_TETSI|nr:hypothetical protein HHK36_026235 [Tetracentron sinense]